MSKLDSTNRGISERFGKAGQLISLQAKITLGTSGRYIYRSKTAKLDPALTPAKARAAAKKQRAQRKQHYPPHAQGSSSAGTRMPVSMLEYSQRYQLSPFCLSLMGRAASAPAVFKNSLIYPSSQSWGRWSG